MPTFYLDLETYCEVPIRHGTHAYAAQAEIMLFACAIDDGPISVHTHLTDDIRRVFANPDILLCAHNSAFDRTVLRHAWGIDVPITRWRDTMVKATTLGLPGALGQLCEILQVPADKAKDKEGRALVMLFCKPRPVNVILRRATELTHLEEWTKFVAYASNDVAAMRCIDKLLPDWNYKGAELDLWHLDQTINDRGIAIDTALVTGALAAVEREKRALAAQAHEQTRGAVAAATQRDVMLKHILAEYGVALPDLTIATVERRAQDPSLPQGLRDLLNLRLQASTTSTAKYTAFSYATSSDGRLRGTLSFCGASRTGRWAGRVVQLQNLARGTLKHDQIEPYIEAIKNDVLDLVTEDRMEVLSSTLRGCLIAAPGNKLVQSDLSNIEGRVAAFLCGEKWKLDAFRAFDAGTGPDLYKLAFAKAFRTDVESVTPAQRQIGKTMELALGFAGGVGAFITFANAFNIDLEELSDQTYETLPSKERVEAEDFFDWFESEGRSTFGLSRQAFVTCDTLKRMWRNAHPRIVSMWAGLESGVHAALKDKKAIFTVGPFKIQYKGSWLRVRLPSGRSLCYPQPVISDHKITFMGTDQYTRKWSRLGTFGGKLFENVVQATARDVLASSMQHIESAGFEIVTHVHDEIVAETPQHSPHTHEQLSSLMATVPAWALGLPLAAAGFEATRYRK